MRAIGVLARARACFDQRFWGEAYRQFATADAATPLDLDDLEKLALAAHLTGHGKSPRARGLARTVKPSVATTRGAPLAMPS